MKSLPLTLLVLISTMVGACDDRGTKPFPVGSDAGADGGAVVVSPYGLCSGAEVPVAACDASELFDWKTVPVIDLSLPAATWIELKKNARDEQYTEADLTFENHSLGKVALRFKGGYGTLFNCFDKAGNQTCTKLSMKLKFNKYDPAGRFFGLKQLNLHSMSADGTQLHDRVAYRLYREMGIMAPRSSWATVRVNGETQGLYAMVEQIDGRFTDDRWPAAGDGNLYKEPPLGSEDPAHYAACLETNEATATHEGFVAFAHALNTAAPEARAAVLATYTDPLYLANYMAVDDAIYNWDGFTAIYRDPASGARFSHNYYFYQDPARPFFWPIPWDLDNTFMLSNGFGLAPYWATPVADCAQVIPVFGGSNFVTPASCSPFFQAVAADRTAYHAAVATLLDGPFAEAKVLGEIDADAAFIAAAVAADPLGPGATSWAAAVAQFKASIPLFRARLIRINSGKTVRPLLLSTTENNDFEAFDNESALTGPMMMANPGSMANQSINLVSPLAGERDLRIDFEYRNTAKPWDQWLNFALPLAGNVVDLRAMTGIRVTVRASASRVLRVDLQSQAQSASNRGIRNGWDVAVTAEPKTVELLFAAAKVPGWATDPKDDLAAILATVAGLVFQPQCQKRGGDGFLPPGVTDSGWVAMDDLQFF